MKLLVEHLSRALSQGRGGSPHWSLAVRDIQERLDLNNVMVVSPDVGGVVRARGLAKRIDAPLAIVDKRRERPGDSEVMNVIGNVKGRTCILVDDIVDSGGTLCNAAEALLEVALLRAECSRTGVREVTVVKNPAFGKAPFVARISPLPLRTSQAMRVQRLFKGAVVKADAEQVQLPLAKSATAAVAIVEALRTIVPPAGEPEATVVASSSRPAGFK